MSTTTIETWGDISTKLFYKGKEIVQVRSNVTPNKGATLFDYTKKSNGETVQFCYADEATVVDRKAMQERRSMENDILKAYRRHEISADEMAQAIKALANR